MTAGTVTPYRSAEPAGRDGFAQLLRAEWIKFRSVRGWVIGMVVAALLMLAVGLLGVQGTITCASGPHAPVRHGAACVTPIPVGPGGEPVTDNFYFVRQPLTGNGSITARVTSLTGLQHSAASTEPNTSSSQDILRAVQPWSKAGIIIKQGTRQGSAYAAMMVTGGNGVRMQYDYTQDAAGLAGRVSAAHPRWLRLTRSGDTITGYDSADGTRWTKVGSARLSGLPRGVQVGLFATSPTHVYESSSFGNGNYNGVPTMATGVFDRVSVSGQEGGAWTGDAVGGRQGLEPPGGRSQGLVPKGGREGYQRAGGAFTVTGSGDIAPVTGGPGSGAGPSGTIEQHLVGAFAGLIAVVVIATMFITAEYRRGLIRVTLAASPRRGRVLAAKAVVIGLVTFIVGLVAAVIAVLVGNHLSRNQGVYVFSVSWLTEARVVAGTAAVLAVGAVLALAVGTILRRSAAAITAVIVGVVLTYILAMASLVPLPVAEWLLRVTPAAGFAIQQSLPKWPQVSGVYGLPDYYPLAPWAGFAVLCGYAVLAMGAAVFLLRRRDA
ncbi:MAG TPA: ABC transporter permease subunit [Streptosporangiaceae bacterium]|nr:ABC transporter permease subunit [Streptosporangiaceae bacterium]